MSTDTATQEPATFTEALLGKDLVAHPALNGFRAWPIELRATAVAVLLGSLVLLPYLGAVGLWDPWETHYGEVAREMIQRNDYVHPYWENAWFFSKPAFTMWMQALGMQVANLGAPFAALLGAALLGLGAFLVLGKKGKTSPLSQFWGVIVGWPGLLFVLLGIWGATKQLPWKTAAVAGGDGALPIFLEWGFRLPFASASILAVALLTYALTRVVNARAALATAFVLLTMPTYFLISRQAVTDTPIVAATIAGLSCALVALFDAQSKQKALWWYAAYVFFAVATLGKGLLGFGVPLVLFMAWYSLARLKAPVWVAVLGIVPPLALLVEFLRGALMSRKWRKPTFTVLAGSLGVGLVVAFVASSWAASTGVTFIDAAKAAASQSATLKRLDAPFFMGLTWGSLAFWTVATVWFGKLVRTIDEEPPAIMRMAFEMRLGTGILLFLAVCLPWYYEMFTFWRVDDESKLFWFRFLIHDHFARLGQGVHTTTPGGAFTYFIEQGGYAMYPWVLLIPAAMATVGGLKLRGGTGRDKVALVAVLWFAISWILVGASATKFHHYVFPMLPPLAILFGLAIDRIWSEGLEKHALLLILGVPLLFLVGKDLAANPKHFTDLFVYNYDRPYPQYLVDRATLGTLPLKSLMGWGFLVVSVFAGLFALQRQKSAAFTTVVMGVLFWTLWFNWSHWVDLSHHWTQRDQFWRYYTQRKPNEPIAAFLMNWRGETFYSRNTVKQIKDNANVGMANYAAQPGRKWSLVEHARLGILKGAAGAGKTVTLIDQDLNNKFVLVTIE